MYLCKRKKKAKGGKKIFNGEINGQEPLLITRWLPHFPILLLLWQRLNAFNLAFSAQMKLYVRFWL